MWPNPQETANLVTFSEGTFSGKLQFFCSKSDSVKVGRVSVNRGIKICIKSWSEQELWNFCQHKPKQKQYAQLKERRKWTLSRGWDGSSNKQYFQDIFENVNISEVSCRFLHIHWKIVLRKTIIFMPRKHCGESIWPEGRPI